MKWSDATTAQNHMTQFDEIISDAAFLFSFSRNILILNVTVMNIGENVYCEIT